MNYNSDMRSSIRSLSDDDTLVEDHILLADHTNEIPVISVDQVERIPKVSHNIHEDSYNADRLLYDREAYLDFGSIKLKIDQKFVLYCEIDSSGNHDHQEQNFFALHCIKPGALGGCNISAYSTPGHEDARTCWTNVMRIISRSLRDRGISAHIDLGVCDGEVVANYGNYTLHIIGNAGNNWFIRGVAFVPQEGAVNWLEICRTMVKSSVVILGERPMPAYTYLPLTIPAGIRVKYNKGPRISSDDKNTIGFMATDTYHRGTPTCGGAMSYIL